MSLLEGLATTGQLGASRLSRSGVAPSAVGLLVVAALATSDYGREVGFRMLLLLSLCEAWNLMAGHGGLVCLGTASFFGIGAYGMVLSTNAGVSSHELAMLGGGVAAALAAALVAPAVFRLRGLYFSIGTLALAEALRLGMVNAQRLGGARGLFLSGDPPSVNGLYLFAVALTGLARVVMTLATRSRFSILLRAVRDDEDAAVQLGVRAFRVKLVAFASASFLIGIAGALQALKMGAVEPYGSFGMQWTVNVLSAVIIGGQGRTYGPLAGVVFSVVLAELLADYPALHLTLTGAILVVVIRLAPLGLAGLAEGAWRTRRQVAR